MVTAASPFMPELPSSVGTLSYDSMVESWRKGIQDIVGNLYREVHNFALVGDVFLGEEGRIGVDENDLIDFSTADRISFNLGGAAILSITSTKHINIWKSGELRFYDDDDNAYISFKPNGTLAANYAYTLPTAFPSNDGKTYFLNTTYAGVMSWLEPSLGSSSGTLDDIDDGTTYGRVKKTSIDEDGIVILDQVVDGTYSKVLTTAITAGNILLSETSGDLDDISDGTSYAKVSYTNISAGQIILSGCSGDADDIDTGSTNKFAAETGAVKNFSSLTDSGGTLTISTGTLNISASDGIKVSSGGDIRVHNGGDITFYSDAGTTAIGAILNDSGNLKIVTDNSAELYFFSDSGQPIWLLSGANILLSTDPISTVNLANFAAAEIDFYTGLNMNTEPISGVTTLTASGEIEGGSLDINGIGDFSGNLASAAHAYCGTHDDYWTRMYAGGYYTRYDLTSYAGVNGTFTDNDGNTVRVRGGIITDLTEA